LKSVKETLEDAVCPYCLCRLSNYDNSLICQNKNCSKTFPVINGIPILINEEKSVFRIQDYQEFKETTFKLSESKIESLAKKLLPSISLNIKAKENYKKLSSLLKKNFSQPMVLVIGGSIAGEGMESILNDPEIRFIEGDVTFGTRTQIIFDAHSTPFPDKYFDCVIIQAVLEHVVDPFRCVEEIHRVLKKNGLVYAETPFIVQVHMGKYDFHRFTHLGHRRLFRNFEEIDSGVVCGPGMALAWSYSYFIFSFFNSKKIRKLLIPFTRLTSFFLKYFDYLLMDKPGAFDAAAGFYFMGRKSDSPLDDRELLKLYKGLDD
jgi:SAM-dependent methyltransferase